MWSGNVRYRSSESSGLNRFQRIRQKTKICESDIWGTTFHAVCSQTFPILAPSSVQNHKRHISLSDLYMLFLRCIQIPRPTVTKHLPHETPSLLHITNSQRRPQFQVSISIFPRECRFAAIEGGSVCCNDISKWFVWNKRPFFSLKVRSTITNGTFQQTSTLCWRQ